MGAAMDNPVEVTPSARSHTAFVYPEGICVRIWMRVRVCLLRMGGLVCGRVVRVLRAGRGAGEEGELANQPARRMPIDGKAKSDIEVGGGVGKDGGWRTWPSLATAGHRPVVPRQGTRKPAAARGRSLGRSCGPGRAWWERAAEDLKRLKSSS